MVIINIRINRFGKAHSKLHYYKSDSSIIEDINNLLESYTQMKILSLLFAIILIQAILCDESH
jgi:hypothetical protein